MTNASQAVVNRYAYTPFGEIAAKSETWAQPFTYVGQYGVFQESDNFYYMRARYYDASVGRFVSEDPKGFDGGDVNLYAYVQNNPIMLVDPLGLCASSGFWGTMRNIADGVSTAITEGVQGAVYATGQAANDIAGIAANGPPLAQGALALAGLTTVGPVVAAGGIAAGPPAAAVINSTVIASPVTTVALSYAPQINQATLTAADFISGYLPGTPPPSKAGYAGGITSNIIIPFLIP